MSEIERSLASMSPEELIAVITEGLDEDERAARECGGVPWVTPIPRAVHVDSKAIADNKVTFGHLGYVGMVEREHDRRHIACWDPLRVLADVESKRAILAEHGIEELGEPYQHCRVCHDYTKHDAARAPCRTLQALARPYLTQETP